MKCVRELESVCVCVCVCVWVGGWVCVWCTCVSMCYKKNKIIKNKQHFNTRAIPNQTALLNLSPHTGRVWIIGLTRGVIDDLIGTERFGLHARAKVMRCLTHRSGCKLGQSQTNMENNFIFAANLTAAGGGTFAAAAPRDLDGGKPEIKKEKKEKNV